MPRSRRSEMPQRQSPRGPLQLKTSGSDSDSLHHRPTVDRSPKLGDRRSPRSSQTDPLNQKKLGTRIADLESQLGQALEELKNLKSQLASAEAAKREAEEELEKKTKSPTIADYVEEESKLPPMEVHESNEKCSNYLNESADENLPETDVFEVPLPAMEVESKVPTTEIDSKDDLGHSDVQGDNYENKPTENSAEPMPHAPESEKPSLHKLSLMNSEMDLLKAKLAEKEKQFEVSCEENARLKKQITEATAKAASALAKEEEMTLKLSQLGHELETNKANLVQLKQQFEVVEGAKKALETEMKMLRVQTEQWKKAADAAAAVLAGGADLNGRMMTERCGSMDKHIGTGAGCELSGGYTGFAGSPMMSDDLDDVFGSGKKKSSGIWMFGDLWKKKSQK